MPRFTARLLINHDDDIAAVFNSNQHAGLEGRDASATMQGHMGHLAL